MHKPLFRLPSAVHSFVKAAHRTAITYNVLEVRCRGKFSPLWCAVCTVYAPQNVCALLPYRCHTAASWCNSILAMAIMGHVALSAAHHLDTTVQVPVCSEWQQADCLLCRHTSSTRTIHVSVKLLCFKATLRNKRMVMSASRVCTQGTHSCSIP